MNDIALSVALIWGMHGRGGSLIDECMSGCSGGAPVGQAIVFAGNDNPVGVVECIFGGDNEGLEGEGGLWAGEEACATAESDDRGVVAPHPAAFSQPREVPLADVLQDDACEPGTPSLSKNLGSGVGELDGQARVNSAVQGSQ